nr:putative late blight resistance protein homolog R1B-17 [Ipomoea batatas]
MAFLAVTSLMRTVEIQFLHPQPRVILTNKEQIKSLHEKLGHLLVFLEEFEKIGNNCAEMKELTDKIRKVSVKAEDDYWRVMNQNRLSHTVESCYSLRGLVVFTHHLICYNRRSVVTADSKHLTCDVCHYAKQKRSSFPISLTCSKHIFDLVHLDIWGPFPVCSLRNEFYFLTIVDDHSRFTWIHLMRNKGETRQFVKNFHAYVLTQFGIRIKTFRSDNGSEFKMHDFFSENGIIHQTSCVNTPQQNAIVECKHQHILSVARSLRFQAHLPLKFWGHCKLGQALQRVVEDIEELMQTTRNTSHLLVNNLTVGGPSQPTSNVEDNAMVGHSEELIKVKSQLFRDESWLSLKVVEPDFHLVITSEKCRTILCFNMVANCDYEWYLLANSFKKLTVLDLSKINFWLGMPLDITDLVFLRIEDGNGARRLPPGIWDLPQLRHLEINHQVPIDGLPKMVQENLQTLYWLSTSQCTIEVFKRIPNVKDLGIIARCQVSLSQGLNDHLWCLNYLERLRVRGSYHPLHLPPQGNIFPQNLKELTFERTLIPWEAMTIISLLPNLEVLKLKNFACVGQEWQLIEEGSFPQLKVLLISLTNLKEWKADSLFPKLEQLLLRNCFELKKMPEWIGDIITLQLIKLEYCYSSLVTSAMTVKEQLDNYGNDKYEVAELLQMSWFEIGFICDIRCLSKMTCYSAYLVFKLVLGEFEDVNTALTCVRYTKDKNLYGRLRGQNRNSQVFLAKTKSYGDCGQFPADRADGWMEIKIGDFYISSGNEVLLVWLCG